MMYDVLYMKISFMFVIFESVSNRFRDGLSLI